MIHPSGNLLSLFKRGLLAFGFGSFIAIVMSLASNQRWDIQWVYSVSIAMISWLLIDLGRRPLSRNSGGQWPRGQAGFWLIGVSILIAYLLGTLIGDAYCGCSTWELLSIAPRRFAGYILLTISTCIIATYFYVIRGRARTHKEQRMLAERDAAEARLKLLQSQLEPHMLFNTLASLRLLIPTDPKRAVSMLDSLNRYLRATLGASRQIWHPLRDEFDRIRDYLELMSIRMGPRLRYELDLPASLADESVPPLLLQALLENSIKHGLEPSVAGGEIKVSATRQPDGQIRLEVTDNGVGLPEQYAPISQGTDARKHFGLNQVQARLQTAYSGQASFELTALKPHGTLVRIMLPSDRKLAQS